MILIPNQTLNQMVPNLTDDPNSELDGLDFELDSELDGPDFEPDDLDDPFLEDLVDSGPDELSLSEFEGLEDSGFDFDGSTMLDSVERDTSTELIERVLEGVGSLELFAFD
ncbi:hypothetical protein BSLG_005787 [Batrachochytrium salamandrivorans]|nr:hypothetical protein BSLG_005787 [Batrachochytrium salamandrivorans]